MIVADPTAALPEPPGHVTSEVDQDRRLVQAMLAMTPAQRLQTLVNWARVNESSPQDGHPGIE